MYIRNKTMNKGKDRYYVLEDRIKVNGRLITKNIRYLGTAEKLLSNLKELDKYRNKDKKP